MEHTAFEIYYSFFQFINAYPDTKNKSPLRFKAINHLLSSKDKSKGHPKKLTCHSLIHHNK